MHLEYLKEDYKENIWTHKRRIELENKNEQGDKIYLARGRYCKIYKIIQNKTVWACRKDAKPNNAKTNCSGYNRRKKEKGKTTKKWKDEVEEGLNVMGIKNGRAAARDRRKWRKIVLLAKVHNGLQRLRRRRTQDFTKLCVCLKRNGLRKLDAGTFIYLGT
jgi:hypothetical protein